MGPFSWRRSWTFLGILALSIAPAAQRVSAREALGTRSREANVPMEGGGPGTVVSELQISNTTGGLPDTLDYGDQFGTAVAALGDLDGDGVEDVAVAAPSQTWLEDRNTVWVLFLDSDGTVRSYRTIRPSDDAFGGDVDVEDGFGAALARVGDLDSDGVPELAVGAPTDDDGGSPGDQADRGAVWILFLRADGTLKSTWKISALAGGFAGPLAAQVQFGAALAGLGDLDGDGTLELAVGAPRDNDGGGTGPQWRGAVWVLSLSADGSVAAQQKISAVAGGFGGSLDRGDVFGSSLAALGDVDGDGTSDVAAGARGDGDGALGAGATWVLFLEPDGQVKAQQKISATQGGFTGPLGQNHFFGSALAAPGDLDGNGVSELAVGAPGFALGQGSSVWIFFLGADGVVDSSSGSPRASSASATRTPSAARSPRSAISTAMAAATSRPGTPGTGRPSTTSRARCGRCSSRPRGRRTPLSRSTASKRASPPRWTTTTPSAARSPISATSTATASRKWWSERPATTKPASIPARCTSSTRIRTAACAGSGRSPPACRAST